MKLAFSKCCVQEIWPTTVIRMQWSCKYCILIQYCILIRCKYIRRKSQVILKLKSSLGWCCKESSCCKEMPGHLQWYSSQPADTRSSAVSSPLSCFYLGKGGNLHWFSFAYCYQVVLLRSAITGSFSTIPSLPEIRQTGKNPKILANSTRHLWFFRLPEHQNVCMNPFSWSASS